MLKTFLLSLLILHVTLSCVNASTIDTKYGSKPEQNISNSYDLVNRYHSINNPDCFITPEYVKKYTYDDIDIDTVYYLSLCYGIIVLGVLFLIIVG